MEGKTLIVSVLIMSLFMAQNQVDANICCPSIQARTFYNACLFAVGSPSSCIRNSSCLDISESTCPRGYTNDILENTGRLINILLFLRTLFVTTRTDQNFISWFWFLSQGDAVTEYCKLGCVSSVCGALTILQNSGKANSSNSLSLLSFSKKQIDKRIIHSNFVLVTRCKWNREWRSWKMYHGMFYSLYQGLYECSWKCVDHHIHEDTTYICGEGRESSSSFTVLYISCFQ